MSSNAFAFYDPEASCWKTCQGSLLPDLMTSSVDWPRAGMTRNGTAYQRQPSAPRISATAYSSSLHLWPTPRSCSAMAATITPESVHKANRFPNLETVVGRRLWPTPNAADNGNRGNPEDPSIQRRVRLGKSIDLSMTVSGQLNPTWVEWLMGFPTGWTDLEPLETP